MSVMCLIKHKYGRWRRPSTRQITKKCPLDYQRLAQSAGGLDHLRTRLCARCGKQEWQVKLRRKSPGTHALSPLSSDTQTYPPVSGETRTDMPCPSTPTSPLVPA